MHETGPPSIPVPGEAPCAAASITAPTDDSTDALHTADDDEPDGMLNVTVDVSTTVVGGMDDTDGLSEGVTDDDELIVAESLATELTETDDVLVTDADKDAVDDADPLTDEVALRLEDTLGDGDVE